MPHLPSKGSITGVLLAAALAPGAVYATVTPVAPILPSAVPSPVFWAILALLALLYSAIISGYEAAFFRLLRQTQAQPEPDADDPDPNPNLKLPAFFQRKPQWLLYTVLSSNLASNLGSVLFALLAIQQTGWLTHWHWAAQLGTQFLLFSGLVLLVSEVGPKQLALAYPQVWLKWFSVVMYVTYGVFWPLTWALLQFARIWERPPSSTEQEITYIELQQAIEMASETESPPEEKKILKGLLDLDTLPVSEVMVPSSEIKYLRENLPPQEVLARIRQYGHSRIPVYKADANEVLGVLYLKDLVTKPRSAGQIELENWRQRIRMPYYVQPTQRVGKVFEEMKRKRQHLAIVQDAQAQIVGLVTLQDIIEYIFGDLQEEQDAQALRYITEGAGRFVMDGNMPLPALAKLLGIAPHVLAQAQEQSETLGGLLVSLNHGKTPTKGSMWEWAECRLEVLAIMGSAVQQVRAERLRTVEAASTNAPPPPTPNPAG